MSPIETTLWLGVATASLAFTTGATPVFEPIKSRLPGALAGLVNCPYCLAHWIAAVLALVFRPMPFTGTWIDLLPVVFVAVTVAALIILMISVLLAVERAINGGE